jgi:hypothetical protein
LKAGDVSVAAAGDDDGGGGGGGRVHDPLNIVARMRAARAKADAAGA